MAELLAPRRLFPVLPTVTTFVFGLAFVLLGVCAATYSWQKTSALEPADGVVTQAGKRRSIIHDMVAGRGYTISETRMGVQGSRSVGEEVTVLYDPARPEQALVESFTTLWLLATLYAGVGALAWLVGAVLLLRHWRSRPRERGPSAL